MRSVAVDIGSYSIKVAEVEATTHSYRVVDYLEIPLTQDLSADTRVLIIDALRKIAHHYQGRKASFVFAVKQEFVSVRYKAFPFKERHKIVKSLPFQLVDEVPFDHNDAIYEAKLVATIGQITEVLAFICPQQHIKEILSLATDAGINPKMVTAQGVATANLVSIWNEPPMSLPTSIYAKDEDELNTFNLRNAHGILEIGHQRTLFSTYIDKHLIQTYSLYFGGLNIIKNLMKRYEISETEAMQILREKGFVLLPELENDASEDQIIFSNTIKESLNHLISLLKRMLLSLSSKQKLQFSHIKLLGGVSGLTSIDGYLSQQLGTTCELLNHCRYHQTSVKLPERTSGMAIGMAIEGLRQPKNPPVNFRKNEFAFQDKSLKKFWKTYNHSIKVVAACIVAFFIYTMVRSNLADSLVDAGYDALSTQSKAPGINLKRVSLPRIQKFIRTKRRDIKNKQDLSEIIKIPSALDSLSLISSQFMNNKNQTIEVKRLLIRNNHVQIEGETTHPNQKALIQSTLKGIARNGKVQTLTPTFTSVSKDPTAPKKLSFAYQFTIKHAE